MTTRLISAIFTAFFALNLHAAPIDFIKQSGFITDTISGLDYRSAPTVTNHLLEPIVANDFATGGVYEGWRHGTFNEFKTMFKNYNNFDIENPSNPQDGIRKFMLEYGFFTENEFAGTLYTAYLDTGGILLRANSDSNSVNFSGSITESLLIEAASETILFDLVSNFEVQLRPRFSNFIVRNSLHQLAPVPILPALLSFGPAIIGLLAARRKQKN